MHQRTLITRTTVKVAAWTLLASTALALTLIACGPGPTNDVPPPTGDISIAVTVVGDGRATLGALDFSCNDTCTLVVDEGTDVSLAAVPNAGRVLVAWDGPCSPFEDTCAWTANEDVAVTVTFAPHALRFDLEGDGEGRFVINAAGEDTVCREACGVALQLVLDVTLTYFSEGSRTELSPWRGDCDPTRESLIDCLVRVEDVTIVGKTWLHPPIVTDPDTYTTNQETLLTVGVAQGVLAGVDDTEGDTHTASLLTGPTNGAFDLSDDGSFTYLPNAGFAGVDEFSFSVVDAFGNSDDGTATITVRPRVTLTKVGVGTVTSDPQDVIDCGPTCTSAFGHVDSGDVVTLTAIPEEDTTFDGWSGHTCENGSNELTCIFTVVDPTTIGAAFITSSYTLTVNTDGNGNVIVDPEGTPTGVDNTFEFDHGTLITLTAEPDDGYAFTGWTDITCNPGTNDDTCIFTITNDTDVTAEFAEE